MQPIQKFSDYFKGYQTTQEAIREADLQKEYGEVFMALLKKYGVNSPAELDEEKKKAFFNEIGELYKKGEGQTAKGEEVVDTEKPEPVKEEDKEESGGISTNEPGQNRWTSRSSLHDANNG